MASAVGAGSVVVAGAGRRLTLGKLIKSGGAGSVFRVVDDTAVVAKIYHPDQRVGDYAHRIAAMLAMTPDLPVIDEGGRRHVQLAWPLALLHAADGDFLGFLMPAVDVDATSELELILQEKQARAHGLPTGLGAKVTLAANLAAVIAALHRQRHHVVDMKPVNLRFYPRSLYMAMLDCDGFGIRGETRRFAAPQFTPDYLAPEFQRGGLNPDGEEAQDRFALAVIVFQLLNFGLHPYSGRPLADGVATDIPGRIAQRAYGYGLKSNPQIAPSPVSGHAQMPADLRMLFDRAFERTGEQRPSAAEWAATLRNYAQRTGGRLRICGRDREHQHFTALDCAACARTALIANASRLSGTARKDTARRVAAALPGGGVRLKRASWGGAAPPQGGSSPTRRRGSGPLSTPSQRAQSRAQARAARGRPPGTPPPRPRSAARPPPARARAPHPAQLGTGSAWLPLIVFAVIVLLAFIFLLLRAIA